VRVERENEREEGNVQHREDAVRGLVVHPERGEEEPLLVVSDRVEFVGRDEGDGECE
jgi:hypothetical protein